MSRSRRKTKIFGVTTASSEKRDKQDAHRAERRAVRTALQQEAPVLPHPNEFFNAWDAAKDGRVYRKDAAPRDMRK